MQAIMIVRRYLKTACASMHATRLTVLFVAVDALIHGGRLPVLAEGVPCGVRRRSNMRSSGWTAS